MREFVIGRNEEGQRLDKYLHKLLPQAGDAFLYKMLRKKNIKLNRKAAKGKEKLLPGDRVQVFFAEETFAKFAGNAQSREEEYDRLRTLPMKELRVIYEDEHVLVLNKPADMLSQKAKDSDISANERMLGYLIREGILTREEFATFRPSVCNRLDRNTTGILLAGKTLSGLQELSEVIRSGRMRKFYYAIVAGRVDGEAHLRGWLRKNPAVNQVEILEKAAPDAKAIETFYRPIRGRMELNGISVTLLEIHLITGRSHQIRAHLASIGHPVVGDLKYGDACCNEYFRTRFGVQHQLLHAQRVELPGREPFEAPVPGIFERIMG